MVVLFNDGIKTVFNDFDLQGLNPMNTWPIWAVLITGFVIRDFIQWWVHRLLHRSDWLWQFHQVHHSVEQMGFAAHLRYHWMENIVYRTLEYIPLALLGIGLHDFFIIHIFTLAWGHYNHSNISVSHRYTGALILGLVGLIISQNLLGFNLVGTSTVMTTIIIVGVGTAIGFFLLGPVMRYVFNSPEMHLWHHSYELPKERRYGINFGLTLSMWDYLFGTAYQPHDQGNIRLGFPGVEHFPDAFHEQISLGVLNKGFNAVDYERLD